MVATNKFIGHYYFVQKIAFALLIEIKKEKSRKDIF